MIFHSDNQPSSCLGAGNQQILIDGLEGEGVNDTNIDALPLELVGGGEGLVQSNTSSHNSHLVAVRLTNNLQQFTKINTFFATIFHAVSYRYLYSYDSLTKTLLTKDKSAHESQYHYGGYYTPYIQPATRLKYDSMTIGQKESHGYQSLKPDLLNHQMATSAYHKITHSEYYYKSAEIKHMPIIISNIKGKKRQYLVIMHIYPCNDYCVF